MSYLSASKGVINKAAAISQAVKDGDPSLIVTTVNRDGVPTSENLWFGDGTSSPYAQPFVHNIQDQWDLLGSDFRHAMSSMLDPILSAASIAASGDNFEGAYLSPTSITGISGASKDTRDNVSGDPVDIGLIKSFTGNSRKLILQRYRWSGSLWLQQNTDPWWQSLNNFGGATYFKEGLTTKAQYLSAVTPNVTIAYRSSTGTIPASGSEIIADGSFSFVTTSISGDQQAFANSTPIDIGRVAQMGNSQLDQISGTPLIGDEIIFYSEPTDIYQLILKTDDDEDGRFNDTQDFSYYDEDGLDTLKGVLDLATRPSEIAYAVYEKLTSLAEQNDLSASGVYSAYSEAVAGDAVYSWNDSTVADTAQADVISMSSGAGGRVAADAEFGFDRDGGGYADRSSKSSSGLFSTEIFKGFSWDFASTSLWAYKAIIRYTAEVKADADFDISATAEYSLYTGPTLTANIFATAQSISDGYSVVSDSAGLISASSVRTAANTSVGASYSVTSAATGNSEIRELDDNDDPIDADESKAAGTFSPYGASYKDVIMYADITIPSAPV